MCGGSLVPPTSTLVERYHITLTWCDKISSHAAVLYIAGANIKVRWHDIATWSLYYRPVNRAPNAIGPGTAANALLHFPVSASARVLRERKHRSVSIRGIMTQPANIPPAAAVARRVDMTADLHR